MDERTRELMQQGIVRGADHGIHEAMARQPPVLGGQELQQPQSQGQLEQQQRYQMAQVQHQQQRQQQQHSQLQQQRHGMLPGPRGGAQQTTASQGHLMQQLYLQQAQQQRVHSPQQQPTPQQQLMLQQQRAQQREQQQSSMNQPAQRAMMQHGRPQHMQQQLFQRQQEQQMQERKRWQQQMLLLQQQQQQVRQRKQRAQQQQVLPLHEQQLQPPSFLRSTSDASVKRNPSPGPQQQGAASVQPTYVFNPQQLELLKGQVSTYCSLVTKMDQAKSSRAAFLAKTTAIQDMAAAQATKQAAAAQAAQHVHAAAGPRGPPLPQQMPSMQLPPLPQQLQQAQQQVGTGILGTGRASPSPLLSESSSPSGLSQSGGLPPVRSSVLAPLINPAAAGLQLRTPSPRDGNSLMAAGPGASPLEPAAIPSDSGNANRRRSVNSISDRVGTEGDSFPPAASTTSGVPGAAGDAKLMGPAFLAGSGVGGGGSGGASNVISPGGRLHGIGNVDTSPLPPLSAITGAEPLRAPLSSGDLVLGRGGGVGAKALGDNSAIGGGLRHLSPSPGAVPSAEGATAAAKHAEIDMRSEEGAAAATSGESARAASKSEGGSTAAAAVEEFVPTPVQRYRRAMAEAAAAAGLAVDGEPPPAEEVEEDVMSNSEHSASYGLYFPLNHRAMGVPYPMAAKDVGPSFKKRPGIVCDDYSVATIPVTAADGANRAVGDGQETLEERETRLRKALADKMKASSEEVASGSGKKQVARLKRELFIVQVLRLQQACRKHAAEIARQEAAKPFGGVPLLEWQEFVRTTSQSVREVKAVEKEKKRQAIYKDDARRRRYQTYLKAIVAHRNEFANFHRARRLMVTRLARSCVSRTEDVAAKEKREQDRAERKRIQALRMNDIEAYTRLVEETKSERLQYLLKQTDKYIQEIGLKIEEHREEGRMRQEEDAAKRAAANSDDNDESASTAGVSPSDENATISPANGGMRGGNSSGASGNNGEEKEGVRENRESEKPVTSNYFQRAHSKIETVRQPTALKGGVLKEYQLQGLQWMVSLYNNNLNGILADEMGLGKTIQSIALIAYLMEVKHNHGPFLVVVPLSTLSNWVNEFAKWAPDTLVVTYKGTPATRKDIVRQEMESGQYNVLLTTYDYVMKDKHILRKTTWQYIIVDEGHRMKNAQSKFAQTLGTMYQSRNRLLLTGTPLQNNLPELWSLLNFLLPSIFNSVDTFDHWFNQPFATFRGGGAAAAAAVAEVAEEPGEQEQDLITSEERMLVINRLHELLRPFMLRRVKTEVMGQLPEKVEKVLRCDLSGWQRSLYKQIQESGAFGIAQEQGGSGASGKGLSNVFMQLRKVCNHPYLFFDDRWPSDMDLIRSSGKFELLDRMLPKLKAGGHRILMFSQMTRAMDILEDFFTFRGYSYLRLDGATSSEERERRMARFNAPDSPYFVFVLSTRAGGLGLNLATADTVVLFDSDWNPMMDAQAQDRAHRIGQKHEVRVFRLVTDSPVEERIISRATDKLNMTGLVVEAGKFNRDSKAAERRAMLETLLREMDEEGVGDDSGETVVHDNEQINEMMATTADELEQYQAIDRERALQEAEMARQKGLRRWNRLMTADEAPAWLAPGAAAAAIAKAGGRGAAASAEAAAAASGGGRGLAAWGAGIDREGRGARKRRERSGVDYWDGMTDQQFTSLVENGEIDALLETSSDRSRRTAVRSKGGRAGSSAAGRNSPTIGGATWGGVGGGGGGAGGGKRKRTSASPPAVLFKLKPEAIGAMKQVLKDLKKVKDPVDGRLCCELYKKLPPRRGYRDYYALIKEPIDLQIIASRARKGRYRNFASFESDVLLLFDNARSYNVEGSPVYQDANTMQSIFSPRMAELYAKEADWRVIDDGTVDEQEESGGEGGVGEEGRRAEDGRGGRGGQEEGGGAYYMEEEQDQLQEDEEDDEEAAAAEEKEVHAKHTKQNKLRRTSPMVSGNSHAGGASARGAGRGGRRGRVGPPGGATATTRESSGRPRGRGRSKNPRP